MVAIPPADGNAGVVHIKVYNNGFEQKRDDLAIPLEECGTGIGQVLAILFVVSTATSGRTIVIDEPNSFLHPGAARVLIQLLRSEKFAQHQFIIATHSPETIATSRPDELLTIRWEDNESKIYCQAGSELAAIQSSLRDIGVRLSDVYGNDAVIWVEGPTESECFPKLLAASGHEVPPRTEFISVVNTGDLEGPDADTYWRVYHRLASRSVILPETVAISVDREGKSQELRAELVRRSKGLIRFLPRRTYENYLMHPEGIAVDLEGKEIKTEDVARWIETNRSEKRYFRGTEAKMHCSKDDWVEHIDAPKLLNDLWSKVTEDRHNFDGNKVRCSVAITDWLLNNDPESLSGLMEYVASLINGKLSSSLGNVRHAHSGDQ
jgi:hypothetical protein